MVVVVLLYRDGEATDPESDGAEEVGVVEGLCAADASLPMSGAAEAFHILQHLVLQLLHILCLCLCLWGSLSR